MRSAGASADAASLFRRAFGFPPSRQAHVPTGLPLLGHYAAAGQGLALTVALDGGVRMVVAPRQDGRIEIASPEWDGRRRFGLPNEGASEGPIVAGIEALLAILRQRKIRFSGFNAAIDFGAELENEAPKISRIALAVILGVREIYPFRLTATGFAEPPARDQDGRLPDLSPAEKWLHVELCRCAAPRSENQSLEKLELLAALFHRPWSVTSLDLQNESVEYSPLPGVMFAFRAAEPVAGSPEMDFEGLCRSAAGRLGVAVLRTVEQKSLTANRGRVSDDEFAVARYFIGESARVVAAERALREDDQRQFGEYIWQSDEAWRELGQTGEAATNVIAELRRQRICLGARLMVGSNPPSILAFLPVHLAPAFIESTGGAGAPNPWVLCKMAEVRAAGV